MSPRGGALDRIGKYEIVAELGVGGMGKVYRARDPVLDREVALKTVSREVLDRPDSRQRFQREARAAARLQHPNIVTIYELGEVDEVPFIAMELLEGDDLSACFRDQARFPQPRLLRMLVDVARALDFAHKRGVVHRDVKPANVRVLRDGTVKLVDFGIARLGDTRMTRTGIVLGTPAYIAPEMITAGRADHRSDMWAVGVMLYEVLAGCRPFSGDITAVMYQIVNQPVEPLDAAALGFAPALSDVVTRALRKAPADRFRDLDEMAEAIESAAGFSGHVESRPSEEERNKSCLRHLENAGRLLAELRLEDALDAARRAQALEPSRSDIVSLIEDIETQIDQTGALPVSAAMATGNSVMIPTPRSGATWVTLPGQSGRISLGDVLREHGAAAFREVATFGEPPPVLVARLSPDGSRLATGGGDGAVRLWDLRSRARVKELRSDVHRRSGHDARVLALHHSPDGSLLASAHVDGNVRLWDLDRGVMIPTRLRHEGYVADLAFSPDGTLLASGGADSQLKLWNVGLSREGDPRREMLRQPSPVSALAWGDGGAWLVTAHANRVLRVFDGDTRRLAATLRGPAATPSLLLAEGPRLVVLSQDRRLRVFDVPTRSERLNLEVGHRSVTAACLGDGGAVAATVALDNSVRFWDLDFGRELAALWGAAGESFASVSLSGRLVVVALADGRIRLWEAATAS